MSDVCIAAIRYATDDDVAAVLDAFTAELKRRGLDVHGIRQEDTPGHGKDAIDIQTGQRTPLKRPSTYEHEHGLCSLDLSQLAAATQTLRRARDAGADVVVVERFGKAERGGGGLADDLLALMADGIPTVVTVPEEELEAWTRFTGGLGDVLPCEAEALAEWWNTHCRTAQ